MIRLKVFFRFKFSQPRGCFCRACFDMLPDSVVLEKADNDFITLIQRRLQPLFNFRQTGGSEQSLELRACGILLSARGIQIGIRAGRQLFADNAQCRLNLPLLSPYFI